MGKICFEDFVVKFRYIIYFPIISLLLTTFFIFAWTLRNYFELGDFHILTEKEIIINFVSAFDLFLLAIMSFIFAVSLYELYIKKPEKNSKLPRTLIISSLDELKSKLSKIVYLILLINFFKLALYFKFETALEMLYFAISIFFIALSIYFTRSR